MNLLDIPLEELDHATIARTNEALFACSRKVFTVGELEVFLRLAQNAPGKMAKLTCLFLGQEITIYVSLSLVDTLLAPFALRLADMSADAISLFLLTHAQNLAKNIQIVALSVHHADFYTYDYAFEVYSYNANKSCNWHIAVQLEQKFPLDAFVEEFTPYLKGVMASPLDSAPITIPLVASSLRVDAAILPNLSVGDVLILGGAHE